MKCSPIQLKDVKSRHVASIVTINVQNGVILHGHKQRNVASVHLSIASSIMVCYMPDKIPL